MQRIRRINARITHYYAYIVKYTHMSPFGPFVLHACVGWKIAEKL